MHTALSGDAFAGGVRGEAIACNGAWVTPRQWFLDAHYARPQPVYYDDGGMHNRSEKEITIFDHPSTFEGRAASPGGPENAARFPPHFYYTGKSYIDMKHLVGFDERRRRYI